MFKKIITITALLGLTGVLIFGAVNRTLANDNRESINQDRNASLEVNEDHSELLGQGNGGGGNGQGGDGNGQGGDRQAGNWQADNWQADNWPAGNRQADAEQDRMGKGGKGAGEGQADAEHLGEAGELSEAEAAALLFMREEEKLAHDVYGLLYEKWGLPVFLNISQSEQTHTEAVLKLLERYNLDDPAQSAVGAFTDPALQSLYTELVARGSQSLSEALKVGAAIEEIDILDLQERLAETDNQDIQNVFNHLLNGSLNHLQAFVSTLNTQTGEIYQPQYLSAETYQSIIDGGVGVGNQGAAGAGSLAGSGRGGQGGGGYRGGKP